LPRTRLCRILNGKLWLLDQWRVDTRALTRCMVAEIVGLAKQDDAAPSDVAAASVLVDSRRVRLAADASSEETIAMIEEQLRGTRDDMTWRPPLLPSSLFG
jgi:hypothetical protein